MTVLTDFFAANQSQVAEVLRGWQLPPPPLDEAAIVRWTGSSQSEEVTFKSRLDRRRLPTPNPAAIPLPDISTLPHVRANGLASPDMAPLFAALARLRLEEATDLVLCGYLVGPPRPQVTIQRFPSAFTEVLAVADHDRLVRIAEALPEESIASGSLAERHVEDLMTILVQLRALARWSRIAGCDLYALTSA